MSNLEHVKSSVEPVLNKLTKTDFDELSRILIALRRIRRRGSWMEYFEDFMEYFEDFVDFLKKKVEKQDPHFFIYHKYTKFLDDKLDGNLRDGLYNFLKENGYGENELCNIKKAYNEGVFINRLPKHTYAFWMCIFYLYQPRLSQKFFWNELEYVSGAEKALLSYYRTLPDKDQEDIDKKIKSAQRKYISAI